MAYAQATSPSLPSSRRSGGFDRVTVDQFNEHAPACPVNSPRSLAAMRRLGIAPDELQFRPPSHRAFATADAETTDLLGAREIAQRRYQHAESKRQAKLRAVREERQNAMASGEQPHSNAHHGGESSLVSAAREKAMTQIDMEKEEIARMQQRLLTKLNNTLAFEIRRAQTLDRAQTKVDYAHARSEAEKSYRAQIQADQAAHAKQSVIDQQARLAQEAEDRRRLAEETWRATQEENAARVEAERERRRQERAAQVDHRNRSEEKRLQLEAIQEMQRSVIADKEARLADKEAERLRAQEESRRALHEFNEAQRSARNQQLEATAARNQQILEEKRLRFLDKEALAAHKRREFEAAREWEREAAKERAKQKERAIAAAQAQADRILAQKAQNTLNKSQSTAERLAERERIRMADEHERKTWSQDREAHRRNILEQSYWLREERGQQILAKRAELNSRSEDAMRARNIEVRERKVQEAMLAQDRKEQVQRMARVQANQREELLACIQADRDRVESLQQQSAALGQQRMQLRALAEKQEQLLLDQFEKLRASPEKLRSLDPNNVDVVAMGLLSQSDVARLMSFNDDSPAARTRTSRGASKQHSRSNSSARRPRSFDADATSTPIMDRPLPRPQTQQTRAHQYQPSLEYNPHAQSLQTH